MRRIVAIFEEAETEFWGLIALCNDSTVWRTTFNANTRKWADWYQIPLPPIPQDEKAPPEDDDEPHGITGRIS